MLVPGRYDTIGFDSVLQTIGILIRRFTFVQLPVTYLAGHSRLFLLVQHHTLSEYSTSKWFTNSVCQRPWRAFLHRFKSYSTILMVNCEAHHTFDFSLG